MEIVAHWLDGIGAKAFSISATLFLLMNGAAIVVLAVKRDYSLVNRWTSRLLAANLVLMGTGLGIPLATTMARVALQAVAPISTGLQVRPSNDDVEAPPGNISGHALPR